MNLKQKITKDMKKCMPIYTIKNGTPKTSYDTNILDRP